MCASAVAISSARAQNDECATAILVTVGTHAYDTTGATTAAFSEMTGGSPSSSSDQLSPSSRDPKTLPLRVPKFVPALLLRKELADALLFTSAYAANVGAIAALGGDGWQLLSSIIFSATLLLLYTSSTIYHAVRHQVARARLQTAGVPGHEADLDARLLARQVAVGRILVGPTADIVGDGRADVRRCLSGARGNRIRRRRRRGRR